MFQIEITKNYKDQQWREDLKKLLKIVGKNKPCTFYFNDQQIINEKFLENINQLINTGDVSNILGPEDYEEIFEEIRSIAKQRGIMDNKDSLTQLYL